MKCNRKKNITKICTVITTSVFCTILGVFTAKSTDGAVSSYFHEQCIKDSGTVLYKTAKKNEGLIYRGIQEIGPDGAPIRSTKTPVWDYGCGETCTRAITSAGVDYFETAVWSEFHDHANRVAFNEIKEYGYQTNSLISGPGKYRFRLEQSNDPRCLAFGKAEDEKLTRQSVPEEKCIISEKIPLDEPFKSSIEIIIYYKQILVGNKKKEPVIVKTQGQFRNTQDKSVYAETINYLYIYPTVIEKRIKGVMQISCDPSNTQMLPDVVDVFNNREPQ